MVIRFKLAEQRFTAGAQRGAGLERLLVVAHDDVVLRHDGGLIGGGIADEVDLAGDDGFRNGVLTETVVRRALAEDVVEVVLAWPINGSAR